MKHSTLEGSAVHVGADATEASPPEAVMAETTATSQPLAHREWNDIAQQEDILAAFAADLVRCGVVGEEKLGKLLYLALTSRLLAEPISVAVKGPSSGGKSYSVKKVLGFFPPEAYRELTSMSEKYLIYMEESLKHRFLVIFEAAGLKEGFAEYVIRSLLSEGRVCYGTVEQKSDGGLKDRYIEREGPTGLIITTTLPSMHPENETRYLSVTVADTPDQTRHILRAMTDVREGPAVDLAPWREFQTWLADGSATVSVPFGMCLADLIPPVAVRLRRDFGKLLTLMQAHALLHQVHRPRDAAGNTVATCEDYRAVYALVADLIAAGVEATVPARIRETVAAVAQLNQSKAGGTFTEGASVAEVARTLGLDKSSASRRVKDACHLGYLVNLEPHPGKRSRLIVGDSLPDDQEILPSPDELEAAYTNGCTVAAESESRANGGGAA